MKIIDPKLCLRCKGRLWCGLKKCPIYERKKILNNFNIKEEVEDVTPPFFTISWKNYPNTRFNPIIGNIEQNYEEIEKMNFDEYVQKRMRSILATKKINLRSKIEDGFLSINQVDIDAKIKLIKTNNLFLPFASIAKLEKYEIDEGKIPKIVDKIINEELKAEDAIFELRKENLTYEYISRILSSGNLGLNSNKKLVPTRWAITAVDDILSKKYFKYVRDFEEIENFEVYYYSHWGNHFYILLLPYFWAFELLEKWLPGSTWGEGIIQDHEFIELKKDYAKNTTGSYYATRSMILEYLFKKRKKASAIVFREVSGEYYYPVGVWHVRFCVEKALKDKPERFENLNDTINYLKKIMIDKKLIDKSKIMKKIKNQRSLLDYF